MNIGTLFAFVVVALGVIILRRTRPDLHRAFRTPWVPFVPILSVARLAVADAQPAGRDLAPLRRSGWRSASSSTSSTDARTAASARWARTRRSRPARSGPVRTRRSRGRTVSAGAVVPPANRRGPAHRAPWAVTRARSSRSAVTTRQGRPCAPPGRPVPRCGRRRCRRRTRPAPRHRLHLPRRALDDQHELDRPGDRRLAAGRGQRSAAAPPPRAGRATSRRGPSR